MTHVPTGFQALVPFLRMKDPRGFATFCQEALGAEVIMMHEDDDGTIVHGELRIEGCVLELSETKEQWGPMTGALHLFVEDPDALYAKAIEAGATSLFEPADMPYGERSGGVTDAWGNEWYFAKVTDMKTRTTPPE